MRSVTAKMNQSAPAFPFWPRLPDAPPRLPPTIQPFNDLMFLSSIQTQTLCDGLQVLDASFPDLYLYCRLCFTSHFRIPAQIDISDEHEHCTFIGRKPRRTADLWFQKTKKNVGLFFPKLFVGVLQLTYFVWFNIKTAKSPPPPRSVVEAATLKEDVEEEADSEHD